MTTSSQALLSDAELAELRAIAARTFVHRADVYVPTRSVGAAAKTVEDWGVVASAVPCRVRPVVVRPLERVVAGAVAAPDAYDVRFAAGTTIPATAVLRVTGESGGVAFTLWLTVQGAPQVRAVEVTRVVRAVPTAPAVAPVVPTSTTVTLSALTVAEDAAPPTLARTVHPAGAPQDGLWSSSAPSVATVDATTGAVTLVGPGSVTFTFTPTGHPEAAGVSATLTVTAAAPLVASFLWDVLADGAVPQVVAPHAFPVRREGGRRIWLPRSADPLAGWARLDQAITADDAGVSEFTPQDGATVAPDTYPGPDLATMADYAAASPADGASASFAAMGVDATGTAPPSGPVLDIHVHSHAVRLTFPAVGASRVLVYPFEAAPADRDADDGDGTTTIAVQWYIGRARTPAQLGKKLTLRLTSTADPATPLVADVVVTITDADQYVAVPVTYGAFPAGGILRHVIAYADESQRATDVTVLRPNAYPYARPWADAGNTRIGTQQLPIDPRFGLLVQGASRNSWLGSDRAADVTVANGTLVETAERAPDGGPASQRPNDPKRVLWLLTPDSSHETYLVGPVAPHGINPLGGDELAHLTHPPAALWPMLYVAGGDDAQPAPGQLAGFLNPNGSIPDQTAIVPMEPDPTPLHASDGGRLWRARVPVNEAGEGFTDFQPAIRYTGATPLRIYRPASVAEALDGRSNAWHYAPTPPGAPLAGPPTISDQVYVTVPSSRYLRRREGVLGLRFVLPYDPVARLLALGADYEACLMQSGPLGSASLGMELTLRGHAATGRVQLTCSHSTQYLNDHSPYLGGDDASLSLELAAVGAWPAFRAIDVAAGWSAGGFDFLHLNGATYTDAAALPAGYGGPLTIAPKPPGGGLTWEFVGPLAFLSDRDLTVHAGGWLVGAFCGTTAVTPADVAALFAGLSVPPAAPLLRAA